MAKTKANTDNHPKIVARSSRKRADPTSPKLGTSGASRRRKSTAAPRPASPGTAKPEVNGPTRSQSERGPTKRDICLTLLRRKSGASIEELVEATGWQAHSVRGFLSGIERKLADHQLTSEKDGKGQRRYRIAGSA